MENTEQLEQKYKTGLSEGKSFVEQNNLVDATRCFKKALAAAIELIEQSSGWKREKYLADASFVSDILGRITHKAAPARTAKNNGVEPIPLEELSLDEALAKLNALIGLCDVKRSIEELVNAVKVLNLRKARNLPVPQPTLHMLFLGNAGTGKTAVARIVAQIFHALGVLSKCQIVEADRGSLVAGYCGQTAAKTQKVIEKSIGGVLLIHAAYTLYSKSSNDFGQEAIDTLLMAMEDHRDDFVVIMEGYEKETQDFIKAYPTLYHKIHDYKYFYDYTGEELYAIFQKMCADNSYIVDESVKERLKQHFNDMYERRTCFTGNARYVRNMFEKAVQNQSSRIIGLGRNVSDEELITFLPQDFDFKKI